MNLSRVLALNLRHFYLWRGNPVRVIPMFAWASIDMLLWGFFSFYLNSVTSPGFSYVSTLLGAAIFWNFFIRLMHGIAVAFLEDVWSRNFLNLFTSPLSITEYSTSLVLTSAITSLVGLLVMLAIATLFFGFSFFTYGLMALPFVFVIFLSGIALGLAGTAILLRFGPSSEWMIWPLPALFSPFVGVFYPVSVLPAWMQAISVALPPSYVFEALRKLIQDGQVDFGSLWVGLCLSIIYTAVAQLLLVRTYNGALRSGLIARYSAENVN